MQSNIKQQDNMTQDFQKRLNIQDKESLEMEKISRAASSIYLATGNRFGDYVLHLDAALKNTLF